MELNLCICKGVCAYSDRNVEPALLLCLLF